MRSTLPVSLVALPVALLVAPIALVPAASAAAQTSSLASRPDLDPSTARPVHETPARTLALEREHGVPRCGEPSWGRSVLDGSLAARRRPDDLPCRGAFENVVRFELGLVGGGLVDRGDGGWGGLSLQLGLRFHEALSVFYQGVALFGAWDRDPGTTLEGVSWHAVMVELSPVSLLGVAFGPSMDLGGGCDVGVEQVSLACGYHVAYGAHSRVTVELAELPVGGLTATGDVHVALTEPDPRASMLLGLGLRL